MDALFINPNSAQKAYQDLSKTFSAIEPPTWSLLLAESCRSIGFKVGIFDADAERLDLNKSIQKITNLHPRLIVFVIYGQNPNSGTTSMIGALELASALKDSVRIIRLPSLGHTQAHYPWMFCHIIVLILFY